MSISFQKMHANGDGFVTIGMRGQATVIYRDIAKRLGDRNRWKGCTQLAVMSESRVATSRAPSCRYRSRPGKLAMVVSRRSGSVLNRLALPQ